MGYKKDAIRGISWLGFFRMITRGIAYVKIAILARILTPAQYGAADIAILVLAIVEIFTETGINIFLTQKKEEIDKYVDTAWIVSIIRGFIIGTIIFFSAGYIAAFFNAPYVENLLHITALVPVLRGFINPSVIKFTKELEFRKEFVYRTVIFTVESIVSIWLGIVLKTPEAIIYGLIAGSVVELVLSFILASPRPYWRYNHNHFKETIHYGKWLTGTGIFTYLFQNGDNIVVGKVLGTSMLGLYQRAYTISMLPLTEISDVITKVTFPVYVKISDDTARIKRAYLRSLLATSIFIVPFAAILFMFPEFIISIILGNQWLSAAPVLQVLAILGAVRALSFTAVAPFYALKRQDIVTKVTFISLLGLSVTIYPFITNYGLVGAAYSALTGALLSLPIIGYYLIIVFRSSKIKQV